MHTIAEYRTPLGSEKCWRVAEKYLILMYAERTGFTLEIHQFEENGELDKRIRTRLSGDLRPALA